jgi:hypothetical protein
MKVMIIVGILRFPAKSKIWQVKREEGIYTHQGFLPSKERIL